MKKFRIANFELRICVAVVGMLFVAGSTLATIVKKMELPELVRQSDTIVHGTVEQVYVQWDEERRLAYTYSSIRVDDPLKGERRRSVLLRQTGGTVGALHVSVAGMPGFKTGEQVIVFLKSQSGGTFQVVGMNQGKYEIDGDFAVSNVSGVEMLNPKSGMVEKASFVNKAPVASLKAKIRELAK